MVTALVSVLARNRQNVSFGAVAERSFRIFPMHCFSDKAALPDMSVLSADSSRWLGEVLGAAA